MTKSAQLCKYIGLISDKILNLTKKEEKSLCDSLNTHNQKNSIRLFKNDDIESISKKYNFTISEDVKDIVLKKTNSIDKIVLISYFIYRVLNDLKPPIKIEKLEIGEFEKLTKILKENLTTEA